MGRWLIALITSAVAVALIIAAPSAQQRPPPSEIDLYTDVPLDAKLLQLDKRALDEAYHAHILKLWSVWLSGGAKDPKFFQNGLANARRAYNQAAKQISAREKG